MNNQPEPTYSILVVDDDEVIRGLVSFTLRSNGYGVETQSDARSALASVEKALPDLIISDIMMPEMDGLEFLKTLRSREDTRAIPVILLTAMDQTEDVVKGLHLGADDYMVKPFKPSELIARVRIKLERPPVPVDTLTHDPKTGLLSPRTFRQEVERELLRSNRSGKEICLVYFSLTDMPALRDRIGSRVEDEIAKQIAGIFHSRMRPLDMIGRYGGDMFGLLLPETSEDAARGLLERLSNQLAEYTYTAGEECVHLTPAIGYTVISKELGLDKASDQALTALQKAIDRLDLQPVLYKPSFGSIAETTRISGKLKGQTRLKTIYKKLTLPGQIIFTYLVGWVIPFFLYALLDRIGFDITQVAYIVVTVSLVLTAFFIWLEGFLSIKQVEPPAEPKKPYPRATAIIAAYLPNEATTIVSTLKSFFWLDYPAPLQIILAYNTPRDLPVEKTLQELAKQDKRLKLLRVKNSTSKAQNINAAIAEVTGEFVGIFDADHQPDMDSFKRAWKWLAEGYDVVQGRCVVRNGTTSSQARLVAVEFEAIYGVSHPGRMRLHKFGIFGGSNGYWTTELLHKTRMQGSMLTEDIDASMRVNELGAKIYVDPGLISYELAPTTVKSLWNQRLRWAQGWFQVSMKHFWQGIRSKNLSARQKSGFFWLLAWREIYPWISLQMFPIITYWVIKFGGIHKLDWLIPIFVMTTLFTLSVGPGQTYFAARLGVPEIRKHKGWFWGYLLASSLYYTEFKNIIARVAQVKQLFGEHKWRVTPR